MLKEDLQFALSVLKGTRPQSAVSDWFAVLGFLELNKVAGYFYNRARDLQLELPQRVGRRLAQIYRQQVERNRRMDEQIRAVSDVLRTCGVPYAFIKGAVLRHADFSPGQADARPLYAAGERVSNDVDVLIAPSAIGKVSAALRAAGFVNGYYDFAAERIVELPRAEVLARRMNRGETAPFLRPLPGAELPFIEIDVNFALGYLPTGDGELTARLLANATDYAGADGPLRSLAPYDFFLHLVLHQYKESVLYSMVVRGKDAEVYKLLDLYLFLRRGYIEPEKFADYAVQTGTAQQAYAVLRSVERVFGASFGRAVERLRPADAPLERIVDPAVGKTYARLLDPEDLLLYENTARFLREVHDD